MSGGIKHVLIVDDDDPLRDTLRFLLEEAGYTVAEAKDGLKALEYLRRSPNPVIVLLDLMMPTLDGAGLLGSVSNGGQRLMRHRYILLTAGPQTLNLAFVNLLASLKVPVVSKPFDNDRLLAIIAESGK